jgi:hypothetical protein
VQNSRLENSARGIWSLNQNPKDPAKVDPHKVVQFVRALDKKEKGSKGSEIIAEDAPIAEVSEEQELHAVLKQNLSPAAFGRLI